MKRIKTEKMEGSIRAAAQFRFDFIDTSTVF